MSLVVNLFEQLGPEADTTGTWSIASDSATPAPVAPATYDADIDLDGFAEGVYKYDYTVTLFDCTDTKTVTIEYVAGSPRSNDDCAGANPLTWIDDIGASAFSVNTDNDCPRFAAPTDSGIAAPASWSNVSSLSGDLWYRCVVTPTGAVDPVITITADSSTLSTSNPAESFAIALYDGTCGTLNIKSHEAVQGANTVTTYPVQIPTSGSPTTIYVRVASGNPGVFNLTISPDLNL